MVLRNERNKNSNSSAIMLSFSLNFFLLKLMQKMACFVQKVRIKETMSARVRFIIKHSFHEVCLCSLPHQVFSDNFGNLGILISDLTCIQVSCTVNPRLSATRLSATRLSATFGQPPQIYRDILL